MQRQAYWDVGLKIQNAAPVPEINIGTISHHLVCQESH